MLSETHVSKAYKLKSTHKGKYVVFFLPGSGLLHLDWYLNFQVCIYLKIFLNNQLRYHIFDIHPSVDGYLDSLQFRANMNRAPTNVMNKNLCSKIQSTLGMSPRVVEWILCYIYCRVLKILHTDFHSCCTSLDSHQEW